MFCIIVFPNLRKAHKSIIIQINNLFRSKINFSSLMFRSTSCNAADSKIIQEKSLSLIFFFIARCSIL